jgi:hypothetical protein
MSLTTLSAIGLVVFATGVILYFRKKYVNNQGYRTMAKIIDFQPDFRYDNTGTQLTYEFPYVEYQDADGDMCSGQLGTSHLLGKYDRGDQLDIVIFESKMDLFKPSNGWIILVIVGLISIFVDAIGIV